ncbi:hypothetical protein AGMMS49959_09230 [Planctomycetales bacterium]|nr:hypothetical protein AGMMS49959_09230 [Planctomycetales bacterium]
MLIDDEADSASVSTGRSEDDPTRINGQIRSILQCFDKSAYVGYTATPFANIFIDPLINGWDETAAYGNSLYPRDFLITLAAPDDYFGAARIFGAIGRDNDLSEYLVPIDDWTDTFPEKQKNADLCNYANSLPQFLKNAVYLFFLNIAIRDLRGASREHNSMLVHVSRLTGVHKKVKNLLGDFLQKTKDAVMNYAGRPEASSDWIRAIGPIKSVFTETAKTGWGQNETHGRFLWKEILAKLTEIINTVTVGAVHTGVREVVYGDAERVNLIAVGGNSLARGFTLENLSVSYFVRNTLACDTLLQMGRWFGYRPRFDDLCRIFMPLDHIDNFKEATAASSDLFETVERMNKQDKTPWDFLLTIPRHPASQLLLTARNKSLNMEKYGGVGLDGKLAENGRINVPEGINSDNKDEALDCVTKFICGLPQNCAEWGNTKNLFWRDVSMGTILSFIKSYPISVSQSIDRQFFERYIGINADLKWQVALIQTHNSDALKALKIGNYEIKKPTRNLRDHHQVAVSGSNDEFTGLDESTVERIKVEKNGLRGKIREERGAALLMINIVDIYDNKEAERELVMTNVPLLSVSFPGSFTNPVTKPCIGMVWNREIQKKLDAEAPEESDDFETEAD